MELLKDESDVTLVERCPILGRKPMHWMLQEVILAFPCVVVETKNPQQGRFPSPGRPHDGDKVAVRDVEDDLTQDVCETRLGLVTFLNVSQPDHRFTGWQSF
jgi:hypothetical protein